MSLTQPPLQSNPLFNDETIFSTATEHRPVPPIPQNHSGLFGPDIDLQPVAPSFDVTPETSASPTLPSLKDLHELVTTSGSAESVPNVSKDELAELMESFARILRSDAPRAELSNFDRSAEISQLKQLLLEAQETIITLLNDRVYDRAKIARLESEVRVLPDLQDQANRAMGIARKSDDFEHELVQVRSELEKLRSAYVRANAQPWWKKVFKNP